MPAPHIVFDIETVLDHEAAARAHKIDPEDRDAVKSALCDEFPKPAFHKIVCIAAMTLTYDIPGKHWEVLEAASLHTGDRTEKELIAEFAGYIDKMHPVFVGFNSLAFDLPVVRARAMIHRIKGSYMAWRGFKPFSGHHIDLCETLSARGRGRMTLDEAARAFGVGAKTEGMDGSRVDEMAQRGEYEAIADYCMDDVTATASLFLLHQHFSGILDEQALAVAHQSVMAARNAVRSKRPENFMQYFSYA